MMVAVLFFNGQQKLLLLLKYKYEYFLLFRPYATDKQEEQISAAAAADDVKWRIWMDIDSVLLMTEEVEENKLHQSKPHKYLLPATAFHHEIQ